jgi:hypothetical protein
MTDDDLLVLDNGWWEPLPFILPPVPARVGAPAASAWRLELDTFIGAVRPFDAAVICEGDFVTVGPRSVVLLASQRSAAA